MKRWIVVLRLASRSVPEKIEFSRFIVQNMTGNALFSDPTPSLDVITQLAEELQTAYDNSRDAGKQQTAAMHAKEFELDT